ncbi:nucleotidyl transferase AbiEii/AbiGii toxin family protein [Actinoplanes sp. KI2]|uniref:nucleotidyl transferase AbiEii/AbiGii toxin family protein n=1 Tax=Actinoplanes sp. KI2 TaxID=2983315 RepID=UPI0021D5D6C3|nr:nucleotidyl transferase AbiEii/AbiGii toxin family protein [Actinoplanes sp. KI2]MCU7725390.1 nucleotidyl transferase AbiEii/AbiGii toxin family protein [Actinoplanes sp. KI2]
MPREAEPLHRLLAEIGLRAGGPFGFALAGGHAVAAHGIIDRPSEDVDLFADWQRRADFPTAVDAVVAAYKGAGFDVVVDLRTETFARLHVSQAASPNQQHRVELVANWRAQPPVEMQIGPVLHPDDVMAGKMDALYNRAAARDFIDIDAAITGGRYTPERLCALASEADSGFDRRFFAQMLGMIGRFDDQDFIDYGLGSTQVAAMRERFRAWQAELQSAAG